MQHSHRPVRPIPDRVWGQLRRTCAIGCRVRKIFCRYAKARRSRHPDSPPKRGRQADPACLRRPGGMPNDRPAWSLSGTKKAERIGRTNAVIGLNNHITSKLLDPKIMQHYGLCSLNRVNASVAWPRKYTALTLPAASVTLLTPILPSMTLTVRTPCGMKVAHSRSVMNSRSKVSIGNRGAGRPTTRRADSASVIDEPHSMKLT